MLRVQPQGWRQGGTLQKLTWEEVFVCTTVGATGFLWSDVTEVNTHTFSLWRQRDKKRQGEKERDREKKSVIWHLPPSDQRVCDSPPTRTQTQTRTYTHTQQIDTERNLCLIT